MYAINSSKKPLFGGIEIGFFGGGEVPIIFLWARGFSDILKDPLKIPFKTSLIMTLQGYFYFFGVNCCLARLPFATT